MLYSEVRKMLFDEKKFSVYLPESEYLSILKPRARTLRNRVVSGLLADGWDGKLDVGPQPRPRYAGSGEIMRDERITWRLVQIPLPPYVRNALFFHAAEQNMSAAALVREYLARGQVSG